MGIFELLLFAKMLSRLSCCFVSNLIFIMFSCFVNFGGTFYAIYISSYCIYSCNIYSYLLHLSAVVPSFHIKMQANHQILIARAKTNSQSSLIGTSCQSPLEDDPAFDLLRFSYKV